VKVSGAGTLAITLAVQSLVSAAALVVPVLAPVISLSAGVGAQLVGVYVSLMYLGAMLGSLMAGGWVARQGAIRASQWGLALCAAGLLLGRGNTAMASGAFLMYLTNLAAIVLSAALVFVLYGYLPRGKLPRQIKVGFAMAAISVAIIAYPLWIVTAQIVSNARDESVVLNITREWVAPTVFDVESVSLDGEDVEIVLSGPTAPVTVDNLADQISFELGRQIDLHVEVFQRFTVRATGND